MSVCTSHSSVVPSATNDQRMECKVTGCAFSVGHFFLLLLNLANLCLLLSPWMLWRVQRNKGRVFIVAMSLAAVSVWFLPWDDGGGMMVGYYAWYAAITLMLCACPIGWRTFAAISVLSAALVTISLLN